MIFYNLKIWLFELFFSNICRLKNQRKIRGLTIWYTIFDFWWWMWGKWGFYLVLWDFGWVVWFLSLYVDEPTTDCYWKQKDIFSFCHPPSLPQIKLQKMVIFCGFNGFWQTFFLRYCGVSSTKHQRWTKKIKILL